MFSVTTEDSVFEVRLLSQELGLEHMLDSFGFALPVILLSVKDNTLLVYTEENIVYHFAIAATPSGSVRLQELDAIDLSDVIDRPKQVKAMEWVVPEGVKSGRLEDHSSVDATRRMHSGLPRALIMLVNTDLSLVQCRYESGRTRLQKQQLSDRVESFQLANIGTSISYLWAVNGFGAYVWQNFRKSIDSVNIETLEPFHIATEFYAQAIIVKQGLISGSQMYQQSLKLSAPTTLFLLKNAVYPYIPYVLKKLVLQNQSKDSVIVAKNFEQLPYFLHSLEILLHIVLDDEAEEHEGDQTLLHRVGNLLAQFPHGLEVIANCARKTEFTCWQRLFHAVGDPKILFERCLANDSLKTASKFLLVLHAMETLDSEKVSFGDLLIFD